MGSGLPCEDENESRNPTPEAHSRSFPDGSARIDARERRLQGRIVYHRKYEGGKMKTTRISILAAVFAVAAAAALSTVGCKSASSTASPAAAAGSQARATIEPRSGSNVSGWATFTERPTGGVAVVVHIENAPPGVHGLHVHEKGDCSAADASSAGGHFNPGAMPHAGPHDTMRHAGDFGNITIEANGTGHLELVSDLLTVRPGPNSVVGKAVVFHEKEDDLKTQPSGNAGARLGCGVVQ
jgi:Cu-Zn family superoxide dismutase